VIFFGINFSSTILLALWGFVNILYEEDYKKTISQILICSGRDSSVFCPVGLSIGGILI